MNRIEINLEATRKDLNFISDPELGQILTDILTEIDSLSIVKAHRSMIYLSMSTVEGILSNALDLNITKIKALSSYPTKKDGGGQKDFDDLVLAEKLELAKDLDLIPPEFYETFQKFKEFRNYMHPLVELKKGHSLDIGLGQVALGLMNHTISKLEKIRFIDEKTWKVISGTPLYVSSQKKMEFRLGSLPTHSFLITEDYKSKDVEINFDLHIGEEVVFNFVYNYLNEDSFQMLRFETRKIEFSGILNCAHKYGWQLIAEYNSKWPIKTSEPNKVILKIVSGALRVFLNGDELLVGKNIRCDNQKAFGFFNEVNNVAVTNFEIK